MGEELALRTEIDSSVETTEFKVFTVHKPRVSFRQCVLGLPGLASWTLLYGDRDEGCLDTTTQLGC